MKKTFYQLPEEQCERLNRTEMLAIRWSLASVSNIAHAQEDLANRLECIPNGKRRWRLMLGQLSALCKDLLGTVPKKQCLNINNTMKDMEQRMVPKFTPGEKRCVIDADDLGYLVMKAKKEACTDCILTDDECRKCELYRILEAIVPLEDYGKGGLCPYNLVKWEG